MIESRIGKTIVLLIGVLVAIRARALVTAMVAYVPQDVLRVLAWGRVGRVRLAEVSCASAAAC